VALPLGSSKYTYDELKFTAMLLIHNVYKLLFNVFSPSKTKHWTAFWVARALELLLCTKLQPTCQTGSLIFKLLSGVCTCSAYNRWIINGLYRARSLQSYTIRNSKRVTWQLCCDLGKFVYINLSYNLKWLLSTNPKIKRET